MRRGAHVFSLSVWWIVVLLSLIVVFTTVEYAAHYRLTDFSVSRPVSFAIDFEAALPRYREHLRILTRMRDLVEAEYQRTGRYPTSREPALLPVDNTLFADNPTLGRADDFKLPGPGLLNYRSDGTRYKIVLSDTGDCFVAKILNPDLPDPRSSPSPRDCVSYGYWSSDAQSF